MNVQNLTAVFLTLFIICCSTLTDSVYADNATTHPKITVNINSANAETLASILEGIGLNRAKAIVDYREQYGPFYSAEELSAVRGIGMKTVEKNAEKIVIE